MQKLRDYYNFLKHDCKADYNSRLFSTYAIGYEDTEVKDDIKKDDTKKTDTTKKADAKEKTSWKSPKTGDVTMLGTWFTLAGASAAGLGALTLSGKKHNRRSERNYTGRKLNK